MFKKNRRRSGVSGTSGGKECIFLHVQRSELR